MKELEQRILEDGIILDNRILKIDNFLNQQIDTTLLVHIGQEFARLYADTKVDRILTIESSGIAVALVTSLAMGNIPVVFARKKKSLLMTDDLYMTPIVSYTKQEEYTASVSKRYLPSGENILIVDDFLASGAAGIGLGELVKQAGSHVVGLGIVVEKTFQHGRQKLEDAGYRVESLARVAKFENNKPVFAD